MTLSVSQLRGKDPSLKELSDEDTETLRAAIYEIVDLAFEIWWQRKGDSKDPLWLLTSS